ncbi:MAG TPA: universal stress protein [Myxococcales bacterium]
MFRKVLLCYDGSREGRAALREGADVVVAQHAEAYLLAICANFVTSAIPEGVNPAFVECEDRRAASLLQEGVEWLRARGLVAEGSLEYGSPADVISETARRIGADLIVVGHRHRSPIARWWSASDEESLLDRVECSILVASTDSPSLGRGPGGG